MGKRQRRRSGPNPAASTSDYRDPEGNVLTLRDSLSMGTVAKLQEQVGGVGRISSIRRPAPDTARVTEGVRVSVLG